MSALPSTIFCGSTYSINLHDWMASKTEIAQRIKDMHTMATCIVNGDLAATRSLLTNPKAFNGLTSHFLSWESAYFNQSTNNLYRDISIEYYKTTHVLAGSAVSIFMKTFSPLPETAIFHKEVVLHLAVSSPVSDLKPLHEDIIEKVLRSKNKSEWDKTTSKILAFTLVKGFICMASSFIEEHRRKFPGPHIEPSYSEFFTAEELDTFIDALEKADALLDTTVYKSEVEKAARLFLSMRSKL